MNDKILATIKSSETDDWADTRIIRPLAYWGAIFFARLGIQPNTVTIISMIIGVLSAFFFVRGSYFYEGVSGLWANLVAILLLVWAGILDCTDGQLARMTGKTSRLGRILDGTAGIVWYIPIYLMMIVRFYHDHDIEFGWLGIAGTPENTLYATVIVAILLCISGFVCLAGQSRVADYYIQAHLFFLKGEKGSELENSRHLQQMYDETPWEGNTGWKIFLKSYVKYTKKQEKRTPHFQSLMALLRQKYGDTENIPADIRQRFHDHSLPLMKVNSLLVFNFRTALLAIFCLIDLPLEYFLCEIIILSWVCSYLVYRHEKFCKKMYRDISR